MRRRLLFGLGLMPMLPPYAAAAPSDLAFRILREGSPVGTHIVRFRDAEGLLEARSEVRVTVRLMGITVYRYMHDTTEQWRGARLVALSSRLDRNGTRAQCEARAESGGLRLRGAAGEVLLPPLSAPLTWWRAASLISDVPLFDPRDGRAVTPQIERRTESDRLRVRVIGGEGAEVQYDAAGTWIGFATTGEDGSAVRYERS